MSRAAAKRKRAEPPPLPVAYLQESRSFATGFLFIIPLLVAYELGIQVLRSDVINWAHGIIRLLFHTFGRLEPVVFCGLVAMLVIVALARAEALRIDLDLFGLMLAESVVYASALGLVCSFITRRVLLMGPSGSEGSLPHAIVLSVGAGVYEEILFRVVLMGGLYYALKVWLTVRPAAALVVAVVVSSAAFSVCHHLGPCGEPWTVEPLVYRFWMGVLFAAIYAGRGLGIVVYTHALYDILVSLSR